MQSFKINMAADGVSGGMDGVIDYGRDRRQNGGPWTVRGVVASTAGGAFAGSASGLAGPAAVLVDGKLSQFEVRSLTNSTGGFGGDIVKSGVSGEGFIPAKSAVSSVLSGTMSGANSLVPHGSGPGSYYCDARVGSYTDASNPSSSWSNHLGRSDLGAAGVDAVIGVDSNGLTDVAFGG